MHGRLLATVDTSSAAYASGRILGYVLLAGLALLAVRGGVRSRKPAPYLLPVYVPGGGRTRPWGGLEGSRSLNMQVYGDLRISKWSKLTLPAATALVIACASAVAFFALHPVSRAQSANAALFDMKVAGTVPSATAGRGVEFRSRQGHFSARFAAAPTESVRPDLSVDGLHFSAESVTDAADLSVVGSVETSFSIPRAERGAFFTGVVRGMSNGPLHVTSSRRTTFRGHPAEAATVRTDSGLTLDAVVVLYTPRRGYLLMAPEGELAQLLFGSFTPTA